MSLLAQDLLPIGVPLLGRWNALFAPALPVETETLGYAQPFWQCDIVGLHDRTSHPSKA
jgi:hypothetical protein